MKNIFKICGAAMTALFLCQGIGMAAPSNVVVDGYLPIPPVAAYSSTFSVRTDGLNWASAQVVVTSVTQTSPTFTNGTASSATLTVVSFTALSTATAGAGSITISSNFWTQGNGAVSGGGPGLGSFNVQNGVNWTTDLNFSSNTACSLAAAINSFNVVLATCGIVGGSVVNTSAPFAGAIWNTFQINSSSNTVGGALPVVQMTGGQDNQSFRINGKTFTANTDFFPLTSTSVTATAIAAAIAAASGVTNVTASAASNVVFATSTIVGTAANYAISSSSQGALTIPFTSSGPVSASGVMIGGKNSGYVFNGSNILLTGNNLGQAQGVWYSASGATVVAPLATGTTYFVIPGLNGNVQLSLTSTGAIAGLPIVFTSSAVKTTADTFTLNVPSASGNSSVQWVASNDNLHWLPYTTTPFNIALPSVNYGPYLATGTVNNFDLGHFDYSYIGLSVTASTAAPTSILAHIVGKE